MSGSPKLSSSASSAAGKATTSSNELLEFKGPSAVVGNIVDSSLSSGEEKKEEIQKPEIKVSMIQVVADESTPVAASSSSSPRKTTPVSPKTTIGSPKKTEATSSKPKSPTLSSIGETLKIVNIDSSSESLSKLNVPSGSSFPQDEFKKSCSPTLSPKATIGSPKATVGSPKKQTSPKGPPKKPKFCLDSIGLGSTFSAAEKYDFNFLKKNDPKAPLRPVSGKTDKGNGSSSSSSTNANGGSSSASSSSSSSKRPELLGEDGNDGGEQNIEITPIWKLEGDELKTGKSKGEKKEVLLGEEEGSDEESEEESAESEEDPAAKRRKVESRSGSGNSNANADADGENQTGMQDVEMDLGLGVFDVAGDIGGMSEEQKKKKGITEVVVPESNEVLIPGMKGIGGVKKM